MVLNNKYIVGDLFAGAGGLSKAFKQTGVQIAWANEIDRNACELYRENFSNVYLIDVDINNIESKEIPDVDILVGGFPCESFPTGRYESEFRDKGGILFFKIIRVLNVKKPRVFLLESTKHLLSLNKGITFKMITEELNNEGYYIKYAVLNSMEYSNIPHNKERLYIVGFRDKKEFEMYKFPEKIQLNLQVKDIIDITEKKENKYYYSENSKDYLRLNKEVKVKGRIHQFRLVPRRQNDFDNKIIRDYDFCPALTLYITNKNYVPVIRDNYGVRMLTPNECFAMQGFFDFKFPKGVSEKKLYRYAAGCSSVGVVRRIAENIIKTLDCSMWEVKLNNSFENSSDKTYAKIEQQTIVYDENKSVSKNIITHEKRKEASVCNIEMFIKKEEVKNKIKQGISINNEEEFTLKKVIPALKNRASFDVKYNHGNDEYGKDVIYRYKDNFGEIKCGAAQVKYGNISGGVRGEIDIILSQIEDAFSMPFFDIKENRKTYINQLLIICSGSYTRNATEKIIEKLNKGYDVRFFDGQDINNLLDE